MENKTDTKTPEQSAGSQSSNKNSIAEPVRADESFSNPIPEFYQRAKVFGVLPVDNSSGEPRTGVSFRTESGEILWLNVSCADTEWIAKTVRSWVEDQRKTILADLIEYPARRDQVKPKTGQEEE